MRKPPSISSRLDGVSESATLKLNSLVQAMKKKGVDVVNLTAGEPDFNVHEAAKKAVVDSVHANRSRYTPATGMPELRTLIAEKTNRQQPKIEHKWDLSNVVVTNGGKQAIFQALLATVEEGEEVIIPSPYWLSYPEMVKIAAGTPKIVDASFDQGFKITPDQLKASITSKTKAVIFNSPSNPTGAVYSREEYVAIGKVLDQHPNIWIISDEIYDRIMMDGRQFCSFLSACPQLQAQTITVNGMSKSYAMTGWRIGWSVAGQEVTQAMGTLQGQSTSGINALAQYASISALQIPNQEFDDQVAQYQKRRDLLLEILGKSGKIKVSIPHGAFYAFVGVGAALQQGEDSVGFAERLLERAKVAVVPGTPFGAPDFVRLSFALDERSLQEGCRRFVEFMEGRS